MTPERQVRRADTEDKGQSWGSLATLTVEVAIRMSCPPSGGMRLEVLRRTHSGLSVVGFWDPKDRSISVSELEDALGVLATTVAEHVTQTAGVQLALHD